MRLSPTARREALRQILADGAAEDQAALVSTLRRHGFKATQATISRDLSALGAVRAGKHYALPSALDPLPPSDEQVILAQAILRLEAAGDALVVIRTGVGMATRVGLAIDRLAWPEAVGTVAGDDTLFVAVRSRREQRVLLDRLDSLRKGSG